MAHEITFTNDRAEIAFVGKAPWHGLGTQVAPTATVDEWRVSAGLAWEYKTAPLQYVNGTTHVYPNMKALYRSDTNAALSIVSDQYRIVQPNDVLEFYRDLASAGDFTIDVAGSMQSGRRVWALARINETAIIANHDPVDAYLLLVTSCDTTLATQAELTSIRVVCANTLRASLNRLARARVRIPHSREFKPDQVKYELGIARGTFRHFMEKMNELAHTPVSRADFNAFMVKLLPKDDNPLKRSHAYSEIDGLFNYGRALGGQFDSANGTRWGLLNAVTEYADHHAIERVEGGRLNSAWFGQRANLKQHALELLTA